MARFGANEDLEQLKEVSNSLTIVLTSWRWSVKLAGIRWSILVEEIAKKPFNTAKVICFSIGKHLGLAIVGIVAGH